MFERLINELSQSTVDKIIEDSTEYSATNGIVMLDPIYLPLKVCFVVGSINYNFLL